LRVRALLYKYQSYPLPNPSIKKLLLKLTYLILSDASYLIKQVYVFIWNHDIKSL